MPWALSGAFPSPIRLFRSLLRACARETSLPTGKKIHAAIVTTGIVSSPNSFLCNALVHMYAVCGVIGYARKVFDEIPKWKKDTVDWTIMMGCFARYGEPMDSLRLFVEMRRWGVEIDDVTMVCMFSSCARLVDVVVGREGHGFMVKMGLGLSVKASNSVMDMYVKTGNMGEARKVFDEIDEVSVVSWSVILGGAVKLEGVSSGREVFDKMPERNEIAWSIMIVGYVESRLTQEAFALLTEMIFYCGIELNYVMISSILSACAQSGNLMIGRWLHVYALKTMGNDMDIMVGTTLVDMYAKCGRIDSALRVFHYMPERNVVAWNAMLSGLAMHGRGKDVLEIFHQMVKESKPDDVTFIAMLSACSHSGLVDQGRHIFYDLESVYGIRPQIEHFACMVDLLGRAGSLDEAEIIIKSMPIPPNEVILGSLLGSCNLHGKLELGVRMLDELLQIDPNNTENHILLSNMYSLAGKLEKANSIRRNLKNRGIKKIPGISSIHVSGQVHQFTAGDKSHPQTKEVYQMLDDMIRKLRLSGYVPNITSQIFWGSVSGDDDGDEQEEKEQALFKHSEKLAVCFGLISTKHGMPLYIFKNLRICQDCHSAIKIASKVYDRVIVVRDRNRFHSFKHGTCSCSDYW